MGTKTTFESAVIGGIEVKNRIVRSATFEAAGKKGNVGDHMLEMHTNLAEGDVGLIITGYVGFSKSDNHAHNAVVLSADSSMENLKALTDSVHKNGSKIIPQINHTGSQLFAAPTGPVYGPSDIADHISRIKSTPFTIDQIKDVVVEFGDAALIAKNAGFDGIQIHAAHGYLLSKFLSPAFNKRTDEYGGSPVNRARFIVEILKEVKARCGADFPVWIKMNGSDFHPTDEGLLIDDALVVAKELAENGIDAIEISGGTFTGTYSPCRPKKHEAYHLDFATKLIEEVSVPVVLVGGFRSIDAIEKIISETKVEAVSMSRPLIREPGLVKRWKDGDRENAACMACNGCFNPAGTQCIFELGEEEKAVQKEIMKFMNSMTKE